jgi:hypothetical protein
MMEHAEVSVSKFGWREIVTILRSERRAGLGFGYPMKQLGKQRNRALSLLSGRGHIR